MTAQLLASRVRKARRASTCPLCLEPVLIGQLIGRTVTWAHVSCILRERGGAYHKPLTASQQEPGDIQEPGDGQ